MDEKEILALQSQIREAETAEATARSSADALLRSMKESGADPLSVENLPKMAEAYRAADSQRARSADLRTVLNDKLGVQAERAAEGRRDESTTVALRFLASAEYRGLVESGRLRHSGARIDTMPVEALTRDGLIQGLRTRVFDNSAGVGSGLLVPDYTGKMVEQLVRPVRLLDRITVGRTDTDTVDWVVENARTDNAAETAFGTAIPESSYGFQHNQTTVKRVGHFVTATRGILSDAGQTQTLLDNRLMNGLERRVEQQLLGGDGVGEDLKGILQYSISSQARGTDTQLDAVLKAITVIRITSQTAIEPVDLLIHPTDYQNLVLSKDANGNYLFGKPDSNSRPSIWGLNPIVTTLVSVGTPIVADFAELATLWVREGAFLAASDSHSDYFTKGLVVVKAEARMAFAVTQPLAAAKITSF